jgi:hypothetical protein
LVTRTVLPTANMAEPAVIPCGVLLLLSAACGGAPAATVTTTTGGAPPSTAESNAGGDIPDTTTFVPARDPAGTWEVSVPQGWSRTDTNGMVTFTDRLNSIQLRAVPTATVATQAAATADELPSIRFAGTNVSIEGVSTVQRKAGSAVPVSSRPTADRASACRSPAASLKRKAGGWCSVDHVHRPLPCCSRSTERHREVRAFPP